MIFALIALINTICFWFILYCTASRVARKLYPIVYFIRTSRFQLTVGVAVPTTARTLGWSYSSRDYEPRGNRYYDEEFQQASDDWHNENTDQSGWEAQTAESEDTNAWEQAFQQVWAEDHPEEQQGGWDNASQHSTEVDGGQQDN